MAKKIAILHYDVAPVVGGVESVILSHSRMMLNAGMQVALFGGRGALEALPQGSSLESIAEMDTQNPRISAVTTALAEGKVPADFEELAALLEKELEPRLASFDHVIAHNIFTTYYNLPLTLALWRLLDKGRLRGFIAWCHDITWTSTHSGHKVHPGFPWDILRTYRPQITYVTISRERQEQLAGSMDVQPEKIKVVFNGAEPETLLGLSPQVEALARRLGVWESGLALLLPVRVTRAKNIEFAIKVVAQLKQDGCRPLLVITGPPDPHNPEVMDYFKELKAQRRELGLEKEVRFVVDSGPQADELFIIDERMVSGLYRASDALLMPSHYEGFGMPVLEAGLVGIPIFCAEFPSATEIGGQDVNIFSENDSPERVAGMIKRWAETSQVQRFKKRIRQDYTWQAIFERDILPLLDGAGAGRETSAAG
jgi:mannosylglucosylglycerate synthase